MQWRTIACIIDDVSSNLASTAFGACGTWEKNLPLKTEIGGMEGVYFTTLLHIPDSHIMVFL